MKTSGLLLDGFQRCLKRAVVLPIVVSLGAGGLTTNGAEAEAGPGGPQIAAAPATSIPAPPAVTAVPPPAIMRTDSTNGLRLNFRGAPLQLVLDYLSDAAGFVINLQTDPRGTVDVWSKDPVGQDEAVLLLNSALRRNGCAAVRNGRILTVLRVDDASRSSDLEVTTGSNPDAVEKSDEFVTQIIPVRYATAGQLVNNLQPLLPTSATLSANESANSLILVASKKDVRRMLKIVSALDSSMATVSALHVFTLHHADAKQLAPVLQQLFSPQGSTQNGNQRGQLFGFGPGRFGPPGSGGQQGGDNSGENSSSSSHAKVAIAADETSNSLIVSSPPELLASVSNILQQIDRPVTEITELRVFKLNNADAGELAEQVTQLFPDNTKSSTEQNQTNFRFGPFAGGPGGTGNNAGTDQSNSDRAKKQSQVLAAADRRSNSLLVSAPAPLMPTIAGMIERLDVNPARKEFVQIYDLKNAEPNEVSQMLQDLFNRNNTQRSSSSSGRNSLTGDNNPLTSRETEATTSMTASGSGTGNAGAPTGQRGGTGTGGF